MNAWSHLPNAHHIDRVLESAKSYPEIWDAARLAAWNATRLAARDAAAGAAVAAARYAARDAARGAARGEVWDATRNGARNAAYDAVRLAVWEATLNAITALIAWNDASKYLDIPSDHLRIWAILSEDPAAVLLLPAVIAFERIRELDLS